MAKERRERKRQNNRKRRKEKKQAREERDGRIKTEKGDGKESMKRMSIRKYEKGE